MMIEKDQFKKNQTLIPVTIFQKAEKEFKRKVWKFLKKLHKFKINFFWTVSSSNEALTNSINV